jgi:hypothetical protein
MRKLLLVFTGWLAVAALSAQCPALALGDFQDLQRAVPAEKEARILARGYDLHGQFTERGATVRRYRKCWQSTVGETAVFAQALLWDQGANSLTFATLDLRHYESLKRAILERHGQTYVAQEDRSFYVGKMFRYEFGLRRMDGQEYHTVRIALK